MFKTIPIDVFFIFPCRTAANEILDETKRVIEALEAAREAQSRAKSAIDQASLDIQNAQEDLTQVGYMQLCLCNDRFSLSNLETIT